MRLFKRITGTTQHRRDLHVVQKRAQKMVNGELLSHANVCLYTAGRELSEYEKDGMQHRLEEALISIAAFEVLIEELQRRVTSEAEPVK